MLTSDQRSFIVQNMSRMGDDELARELQVDEKLVKEFISTINDLVGHLKEEAKSYQLQYAVLLIEIINDIDISMVLSLPKNILPERREIILNGLFNLIRAGQSGQFGELLLESLKRNINIEPSYGYIYDRMKTFIDKEKENVEIISPLSVFSRPQI